MQGGKWIKQKHDEKQKGRGKKNPHQTVDFEIASCQLCLLYFTSHYVAGSFRRWLFVSCCEWNNNDGGARVSAPYRDKDTQGLVPSSAGDNTHKVSRQGDLRCAHFAFVLMLFGSSGI